MPSIQIQKKPGGESRASDTFGTAESLAFNRSQMGLCPICVNLRSQRGSQAGVTIAVGVATAALSIQNTILFRDWLAL